MKGVLLLIKEQVSPIDIGPAVQGKFGQVYVVVK